MQNIQEVAVEDTGAELQRALQLHQDGELEAAEAIYAGLVDSPFAADALHLLGVIAHQQGRTLEAEALVREAILLKGDDGLYHNNLGEIYYARGAYTEALACYQRAYALNPDIPELRDVIARLAKAPVPEPQVVVAAAPPTPTASADASGEKPFLSAAELGKTPSVSGEAIVWAPWLDERHVRNCRLYPNREAMLESLEKGAACAEVGVQTGYFSHKIYSKMRPRELHLLDLDLNQINYERYPLQAGIDAGVIRLYEGRSAAILAKFPVGCLDWIYVDGDHTYAGVVKDIEQAVRVVKPGGVIVFNDYVKYSPLEMCQYGVMEAVNQLCLEHDYEMIGLALHGIGHFDVAVRRRG